jgi:Leucine-rich repeat (LRR) protein
MRDVGLIWMKDLAQKLPQLQALDVSHNKIYSLKNLDEMNALESLVEVNI